MQCGIPGFDPWVGKIPWRRERLPTPVFWPGEFHGLYSPWGHKESDTTERLSLSCSAGLHPPGAEGPLSTRVAPSPSRLGVGASQQWSPTSPLGMILLGAHPALPDTPALAGGPCLSFRAQGVHTHRMQTTLGPERGSHLARNRPPLLGQKPEVSCCCSLSSAFTSISSG